MLKIPSTVFLVFVSKNKFEAIFCSHTLRSGAARYQKVGHRALPGTRKLDIRRCPVPESCIITTALVDGEKDNTMEVAIFEFEVMLEFIEIKIRYNFRAAGCGTESVVDLIITTALVDGEKDKTMQVAIFEFEVMVEFIENKI